MGRVKSKREGAEHKRLKQLAKSWLLKQGSIEVKEEVLFLNKKRKVIADVVGYSGEVIIAVECGGSTVDKLERLAKCVTEIYILPQGEAIPFRWSILDKLCVCCGHKVTPYFYKTFLT